MAQVRASLGQIRFRSIKQAMREAGVKFENDDQHAILVWHDSLKDIDYFKSLLPWQVVNRLPSINVLCRKAPFARIIQRIQKYFPREYSFMPKSYILPFKNSDFLRALAKKKHRYIVKPDSGSLGQGITIIEPNGNYTPDDTPAVAQRYIPSLLLDQTKFDLRVYVLIASISPLEIYVYRNGLARFCSEKSEGKNTIFSQITNVTLNKDNISMQDHISDVSKLISDVFPILEQKGIDIEALWERIDKVIVLSVLAAHKFLVNGEEWQCPKRVYSRCFQVLGFDILIDEEINPYVLEVNYRPSLDYYRGPERRMKVNMLSEAIRIACPLAAVQKAVDSRGWAWGEEEWAVFLEESNIGAKALNEKEIAYKSSNFARAFPSDSDEQALYDRVMRQADSLPMDFIPGIKFPSRFTKGGES
jgi:tubulin polyglutamylase TTLL6/13